MGSKKGGKVGRQRVWQHLHLHDFPISRGVPSQIGRNPQTTNAMWFLISCLLALVTAAKSAAKPKKEGNEGKRGKGICRCWPNKCVVVHIVAVVVVRLSFHFPPFLVISPIADYPPRFGLQRRALEICTPTTFVVFFSLEEGKE